MAHGYVDDDGNLHTFDRVIPAPARVVHTGTVYSAALRYVRPENRVRPYRELHVCDEPVVTAVNNYGHRERFLRTADGYSHGEEIERDVAPRMSPYAVWELREVTPAPTMIGVTGREGGSGYFRFVPRGTNIQDLADEAPNRMDVACGSVIG